MSLAVIQLSVGLNPTTLSVGGGLDHVHVSQTGICSSSPVEAAAPCVFHCCDTSALEEQPHLLELREDITASIIPANPAEPTPCWAPLSWGEEGRGIVLFPPQQLVGTSAGQICRRLVTSCSWTAAFVLADVPQATLSHVANGGLINPSPFSD